MIPTETAATERARPDPDFARRWTEWLARGVAHDRLVRQRLIGAVVAVGLIIVAAAIVYMLLAS